MSVILVVGARNFQFSSCAAHMNQVQIHENEKHASTSCMLFTTTPFDDGLVHAPFCCVCSVGSVPVTAEKGRIPTATSTPMWAPLQYTGPGHHQRPLLLLMISSQPCLTMPFACISSLAGLNCLLAGPLNPGRRRRAVRFWMDPCAICPAVEAADS